MAARKYAYEVLVTKVNAVLRTQFPDSVVEYNEGYLGRVHAKIVSPAFNGLSERAKQALVWKALEEGLDPDEARGVALVMTYGLDELP